MQFVKMHGAGNDYIYVDCFQQAPPRDPARFARIASDRHRGIGGDGLVLIEPSERADARMRMFNADGSESEMCGNAIRCVAKYLYDHGRARRSELIVETGAGLLTLQVSVEDGKVRRARVNMGRPVFDASRIPTLLPGDPPLRAALEVGGRTLQVTCLSMGNPHCVTFVDELSDELVRGVGPQIERHPAFPRRVNAEFVRVISPREIEMRVWERGSGETQACGTGASAACVAGVLNGLTARTVSVRLPGGELTLEWSQNGDVFLTGPATEVYTGEWPDQS